MRPYRPDSQVAAVFVLNNLAYGCRMEQIQRPIIWLSELDNPDLTLLGGKALNLAALERLGLPVPRAYCIPATVFDETVTRTILEEQWPDSGADRTIGQLFAFTDEIQNRIATVSLRPEVGNQILAAFDCLVSGAGASEVAVRSSGITEDSQKASFAGQFATFLFVPRDELLQAVKRCWASPFSRWAVAYRHRLGLPIVEQKMAVIVQVMVHATCAGVMFTAEPVSGNVDLIVIEAAPGLGEPVVAGKTTPDRYVVDKVSCEVVTCNLVDGVVGPVLDHGQICALVEYGLAIERYFAKPQDIEWAIEETGLYLLQARPITTRREHR